ncbi:DUF2147 domain-containing protein [Lewinella sp. 4G2]|uniref:DUF2147 domain-containing protein n=1 Tax=Lewinella sp. 4G2 TaxID=1803372 RepID=UPI0007B4A199|nr:DUF2147 domain-containing protein [Lewinella sp. 4G2]OAV44713.1 hypothetical protein A3850_009515 [Lewinella sp. 4G2]
MRSSLLFTLFLSLFSTCVSAQMNSPEGMWETVDEDTGEAKSVIQIYANGNKFDGKVAKILTGNDDAVCTECTGKLKGKPILGLQIISGIAKDGEEWNGGTILDPQKGAEYRLVVWYDGDPDVLYVRGKHWTGLYRTQTWRRQKS